MGIEVRWYDEARGIWYQEVSGVWTVDDYWESVAFTHSALDAVAPRPVYLMTQVRGILQMPPGFITALRSASDQVRPHERIHVFIGGGMMVRSLYRIRNIINPRHRVHLANTLEDALKLIEDAIAQEKDEAS